MVRPKKLTRKELLNEPDEFISLTGRAVRFAIAQQTRLRYAGLALLALLALGTLFGWLSMRGEREAALLLEKTIVRHKSVLSGGTEEKAYGEVKADLDRLLADYPRTRAARAARLQYAAMAVAGSDLPTAIAQYDGALKALGDQAYYNSRVRRSLANVYARQGDLPAAVAQLEAVAADSEAPGKDEALFLLATLYAKLNQHEKSKEAFRKLATDFPESLYAAPAREGA